MVHRETMKKRILLPLLFLAAAAVVYAATNFTDRESSEAQTIYREQEANAPWDWYHPLQTPIQPKSDIFTFVGEVTTTCSVHIVTGSYTSEVARLDGTATTFTLPLDQQAPYVWGGELIRVDPGIDTNVFIRINVEKAK